MSLKINLIANYAGAGWSALIGIAFLPLYLHFIGAEGYGLVGFFTMLSASLAILDAGLGAVATREAAAYVGSGIERRQEIVILLRSIEMLLFGISLVVGSLVAVSAPLIVERWLDIPPALIPGATHAVTWMGLTIAVQFPTGLYSGCLNGLQRQVALNVANILGSTLRSGGAVLVLWLISPTVEAFFIWQALGAVAMLVALRVLFAQGLRGTPIPYGFSWQSLVRVRHFLGGMGAINVLALLLTQLDKLVLSSVLPIAAFGYYSLAWMLGTVIYRLTFPVFNAYYPKITQLLEQGKADALFTTYRQACELMAVVVVPISLWLAFFSQDILLLWTRNTTLAHDASGALSVIALGTLCNAFMHIPYAMQLAHSYTRLALAQNIAAVIVLAPLTWYLATHFSLTAAALPWLLVNASYVILGAPLMHSYLNLPGLRVWYLEAVIKPAIFSGGAMLLFNSSWDLLVGNSGLVIMIPLTLASGFMGAVLSSQFFRSYRTHLGFLWPTRR